MGEEQDRKNDVEIENTPFSEKGVENGTYLNRPVYRLEC